MRFSTLFTTASVVAGVSASPLGSGLFDPLSLFGIDLSSTNHYGAPFPPWNDGAHPGWYSGRNSACRPELTYLSGPICNILKLFPHFIQCPGPVKPPSTQPQQPIPPTSSAYQTQAASSNSVTPPAQSTALSSGIPPTQSTSLSSSTDVGQSTITYQPSPTSSSAPPAQSTTPTQPADGYHQMFSNMTGAIQAGDYVTYGLVDTVADCKAMCNSITNCIFVNTYYDHAESTGKDGSLQLTCSLFSNCHTSADATNMGSQPQSGGGTDYITNSDGYCKGS